MTKGVRVDRKRTGTWTEPRGIPILRGLGGEEEPVKVTEKGQLVRSEETGRVWDPESLVKTVN